MASTPSYQAPAPPPSPPSPPPSIPIKLQCKTCHELALDAYRLPCCEESICETCHSRINNTCPLCSHDPLQGADCRPNKVLRNTVKAFLRNQEKKREAIRPLSNQSPRADSFTVANEPLASTHKEEIEQDGALDDDSNQSDSSVEIIVDSEDIRRQSFSNEQHRPESSRRPPPHAAHTSHPRHTAQTSSARGSAVSMGNGIGGSLYPMMAMQNSLTPFAFNPMMMMSASIDPQMVMMAQMSQGIFGNYGQGYGTMNGMGTNFNRRQMHWGMSNTSGAFNSSVGSYHANRHNLQSHPDLVGQMQNHDPVVPEHSQAIPSDDTHRSVQPSSPANAPDWMRSKTSAPSVRIEQATTTSPVNAEEENASSKPDTADAVTMTSVATKNGTGPDRQEILADRHIQQQHQHGTSQNSRPLFAASAGLHDSVASKQRRHGSRNSFANSPPIAHSNSVSVSTPIAVIGQGVAGAPTGPKAMREGRPNVGHRNQTAFSAPSRGAHRDENCHSQPPDQLLPDKPSTCRSGGRSNMDSDYQTCTSANAAQTRLHHETTFSLQTKDEPDRTASPVRMEQPRAAHRDSHHQRDQSPHQRKGKSTRRRRSCSPIEDKNSYEEERSHYRRQRERHRSGRDGERSRRHARGRETDDVHKSSQEKDASRDPHRDHHRSRKSLKGIVDEKPPTSKVHGQSLRSRDDPHTHSDPYAQEREARKREREIRELERRESYHTGSVEHVARKRNLADEQHDYGSASTSRKKSKTTSHARRSDWDEDRLARNESEREAARWAI